MLRSMNTAYMAFYPFIQLSNHTIHEKTPKLIINANVICFIFNHVISLDLKISIVDRVRH